jgi:hypothetical protein
MLRGDHATYRDERTQETEGDRGPEGLEIAEGRKRKEAAQQVMGNECSHMDM